VTLSPPGVLQWAFAPIVRGAPHPVAAPGGPPPPPVPRRAHGDDAYVRGRDGNATSGFIVVTQLAPGARPGVLVSVGVRGV
jgi:hypothetical protein